jgi:hypothetical protein
MKKITLTILTCIISMHLFGQDNKAPVEDKKKKEEIRPDHGPLLYITTSTGVNNNTGIVGFNFELPVNEKVTIDAGPGTGTWGYKFYAGAKYYLKPAQRGFAFGVGIAYCPGVNRDRHDLETIYGNSETIDYNKNPQTLALFTVYKYWSIGRKYNRIFVETGWSMLLSNRDKITQLSGDPISNKDMDGLNSGIENGPVFALGISFGLH